MRDAMVGPNQSLQKPSRQSKPDNGRLTYDIGGQPKLKGLDDGSMEIFPGDTGPDMLYVRSKMNKDDS